LQADKVGRSGEILLFSLMHVAEPTELEPTELVLVSWIAYWKVLTCSEVSFQKVVFKVLYWTNIEQI